MALQKISKSQKMLYWVVRVLFPSQKTATKCVALQKYSKSQKMYWMHCYTEQQGKLVTSQSELVFCQLAFLAEASKNMAIDLNYKGLKYLSLTELRVG